MFCANDKIHYVGSGVCLIQEITVKRIGRNRASYYVLKPLHQQTSEIYVPVDKEELVARMRPIEARVMASSPASMSSRIKKRGRSSKASASATRLRSPKESCPMRLLA